MTIEEAKNHFLKTANTRQLLAIRNSIYENEVEFLELCGRTVGVYVPISHTYIGKGAIEYTFDISYIELMKELNTREHIPNKAESRAKRQLLAYKYRRGRSGKH